MTKFRNIDHAERVQSRHERNMILYAIAAGVWLIALFSFLSMPSARELNPFFGLCVFINILLMSIVFSINAIASYLELKDIGKYLDGQVEDATVRSTRATLE